MDNIYKRQAVYSECVELSKKSTKESLGKLISIYLEVGKNARETARHALKKTKNQHLVFELLEEMLEKGENEYLLLSLGMYLSRERYIKRILFYYRNNHIDPKDKGFFKNIANKPLNDAESDQITEYIIESGDYNTRYMGLLRKHNYEKIMEASLNFIIQNGIDEAILKVFGNNYYYLELLQEEIYNSILKDPDKGIVLVKYLDLSLEKNQDLILGYKDLFIIYSVVKNNIFLDEILYCKDLLLRVAVLISKGQDISEEDWKDVKNIINEKVKTIIDLENENEFLLFLKNAIYVDRVFLEETLICIYKRTKLYSDKALKILADVKSTFAYREMISFMLTSEDRTERYKYAVQLMMTYRDNGVAIYNYAKDLNDDRLLQTLDEVASKFEIKTSFEEKYKEVSIAEKEKIQVLPYDTVISEFLLDLAKEIKADIFLAAVGFTFSSGLKMLQPLFDYIHSNTGTIELVTGNLQNFETYGRNTKIDKGTVLYFNNLINNMGIKLFTYEDSFYHGKMYYLANQKTAYVIIGSSNISKTAFLDNYELNTFITIKLDNNINQYLKWFTLFQSRCTYIKQLDPDKFDEFNWESELDVFSSRFVHKLSLEEVQQKITELSDEETKFRLNTWIQHNPTEIFSNLNIPSLPDYIVFLFAKRGLAVFESFIPGNAYYTFRYFDFDNLLNSVSELTKTQMLLASGFINRGYHISDKDRLENKINRLFTSC